MTPLFDPAAPVFIVGGGASLRDFDFRRLSRRQVIAINLAHRKVNWARVLFFSDDQFFLRHRDAGGQHFWRTPSVENILTTAPACAGMTGRVSYIDPEQLTLKIGRKRQRVGEMCSGAQAIALAHHLGAGKIVLLGFDNKPGHWAEGEPYAHPRRPAASVFDLYGAQYKKLARLGLDVVNATPGSAISCFKTADISDFI